MNLDLIDRVRSDITGFFDFRKFKNYNFCFEFLDFFEYSNFLWNFRLFSLKISCFLGTKISHYFFLKSSKKIWIWIFSKKNNGIFVVFKKIKNFEKKIPLFFEDFVEFSKFHWNPTNSSNRSNPPPTKKLKKKEWKKPQHSLISKQAHSKSKLYLKKLSESGRKCV
jgi:hypothetical protein